ncbi:hypothetical protein SteCoe_12917 [Stentor coeruleus]|uniref:RING-type domain-containing protein n=1 Tax=Stentor coeruleus TaxID=5963 RepID=A0A1R2C9Q7_9CILI|nr:hypothetical protein SteCoe_12917 [Stentor coeruleus]
MRPYDQTAPMQIINFYDIREQKETKIKKNSPKNLEEIHITSLHFEDPKYEYVPAVKNIGTDTISIPSNKIPSQINIKPSGELIECLSGLINCLIPVTDINKVLLDQTNIFNNINRIAKLGCEEANKFSIFLNSLQCSICKDKNIKIQLSCSHILCGSCIQTLKISESENSDTYVLSCSICNQEVTKSEHNLLFPSNSRTFLEMEKKYLCEKLASGSSLKCKQCFKEKQKYYNTCCYHICKDCVAEQIRSNIFQCPICELQYYNIRDISHEKNVCDCCKREMFFIGDFMRAIEGEKCNLCSVCLSQAFNQGKCPSCKSRITKIEKFEICDFLFTFCEVCEKEVYKGHLIVSNCCKKKTCRDCLKSDEVCKGCNL